ncbi:hypothetical protein M8818_005152 [Zalaria obscura]|uniref:Uncharacterized protein n=1 Tax=Zalaria obscura TaxID=2024903 RepID=A0ACC3SAJ5_9PEZI
MPPIARRPVVQRRSRGDDENRWQLNDAVLSRVARDASGDYIANLPTADDLTPPDLLVNALEASLFKFYIEHGGPWLDITSPSRHFSLTVPRLAISNPVLLSDETLLATLVILRHVEQYAEVPDDRGAHLMGAFSVIASQKALPPHDSLPGAALWTYMRQDLSRGNFITWLRCCWCSTTRHGRVTWTSYSSTPKSRWLEPRHELADAYGSREKEYATRIGRPVIREAADQDRGKLAPRVRRATDVMIHGSVALYR